jgi:hypothetical protein
VPVARRLQLLPLLMVVEMALLLLMGWALGRAGGVGAGAEAGVGVLVGAVLLLLLSVWWLVQ